MRVCSGVTLVGSGDTGGFSLSHPLDCHVYLIDGGNELALVDTGIGLDSELLLRRVREAGYATERIRYLFLTHAHTDHAGGCWELRDRLGARVVTGALTATILERGDFEANGLGPAQRAGLYPAEVRLQPCPVDIILPDQGSLAVGHQTLQLIAAPGHSADHVVYLSQSDEAVLFSGDSIFAGGRILTQGLPDCILSDYIATIRRLAALNVAVLLPSHGLLALQRGGRHLRFAASHLDRLQIPPNLLL